MVVSRSSIFVKWNGALLTEVATWAVAAGAAEAALARWALGLLLKRAGGLLQCGGHHLCGQVQVLAKVLNALVGQEPAQEETNERRSGAAHDNVHLLLLHSRWRTVKGHQLVVCTTKNGHHSSRKFTIQ